MVISNCMQNEDCRMDTEGINKSINNLVVNLSFKASYFDFLNEDKKLLIVEGQTDKRFIEKHLEEDVLCVVANKAFGTNAEESQARIKCKKEIVKIVYGLSKIPMLLKIPKELEKKAVYGMVDLDNDNPLSAELSVKRLFVTDTHDLETLIISSDSKILQRIKDCAITSEDVQKALYLAYQLGKTKEVLFDVSERGFEINSVSAGSTRDIDYAFFVNGYEINVKKIVKYICLKSKSEFSSAKEKKIAERAIVDKRLKKRLNKDGVWNTSWNGFSTSKHDDYWKVVNGHDILSLLRYINIDASLKYQDQNIHLLNRAFEMDLIDNYDYRLFVETKLYKKMLSETVIKSI